jgi:hypothetical protein
MIIEIELPQPHEKQQFLLDNRKRFNALKCGRRFGKTELCQELILETFERGEYAGYFSPTYKDLYEVWKTTLNNFHYVIQSKSETVKQVVFINGAKVDFWSMEEPNSGRGRKYHRAIMDECEKANKFQEAWEQAISPTLTDFGGDAYFLSTPKFGDTYFKELCKKEIENPDLWKTFIYSTYDNPHIPVKEIEIMRQMLPTPVFDCEYMAMDVDGKTLNPFAHQYDSTYHESTEVKHNPRKQLYIAIDFNLNQFAVTFWHHWQDQDGYHWHGIDEAEIAQGSIPAMIELINQRYHIFLHTCIITGDSMGLQRQIALKDNASHYLSLQRGLKLSNHQIQVPHNPTHENSRDDVNRVLFESKQEDSRFHFKLNPKTMPNTCRDFRNVQCDATGAIMKGNRKDLNQRGDFIDCSRYLLHLTAHPLLLKMRR